MAYYTPKSTGYVGRRALRDFSVGATQLDEGIHDGTYCYIVGDHTPRATTGADSTTGASASGAPTGATGAINRIIFDGVVGSCPTDAFVMGTQTILAPVRHATLGINVSLDATANDGMQYHFGGNIAYNRFAHTVGTTADSFIKATVYIEDADGTDAFLIGWVKQETAQADFNDYADLVTIGDVSAAAKVVEIQGGAATVTSASLGTITDGAAYTFEVRVTKAGRVSYYFNGSLVNAGTTYTATNGLVLIPFMHFIQDTNVTEAYLQKLEIGRLRSVNANKSSQD